AAWTDIAAGSWQHAALGLAATAALASAILTLILLIRQAAVSRRAAREGLARLEDTLIRLERAAREEGRAGREEAAASGGQLRAEVEARMTSLSENVLRRLDAAKAETAMGAEQLASRVSGSLGDFGRTNREQMTRLFDIQKAQHTDFAGRLTQLAEGQARAAQAPRPKLEEQLTGLRTENAEKLETMRATVDEKLQGTLERRLGESF